MSTKHAVYVEHAFKNNHKSISLSRMSVSDKILHLIGCKSKIEPMKEFNRNKELIVNVEIPVKDGYDIIFPNI